MDSVAQVPILFSLCLLFLGGKLFKMQFDDTLTIFFKIHHLPIRFTNFQFSQCLVLAVLILESVTVWVQRYKPTVLPGLIGCNFGTRITEKCDIKLIDASRVM